MAYGCPAWRACFPAFSTSTTRQGKLTNALQVVKQQNISQCGVVGASHCFIVYSSATMAAAVAPGVTSTYSSSSSSVASSTAGAKSSIPIDTGASKTKSRSPPIAIEGRSQQRDAEENTLYGNMAMSGSLPTFSEMGMLENERMSPPEDVVKVGGVASVSYHC